MLHRRYLAISVAAFALANSAHAMDESEKRKKVEAASTQLNMNAATIIHCAQQIHTFLHPKPSAELDKQALLKRDDTIKHIPRSILFQEALQSLQSNSNALIPLLTDVDAPITANNTPPTIRSTIASETILSALRDALLSAHSKLRKLNRDPQARINASKLLGRKDSVDLSECLLGIGHASKLLFTQKASDFPPAILLEYVYPANICLVGHSTVHGMPSHCHAILQKVLLPYEIIKNAQVSAPQDAHTKETFTISEQAKRTLVRNIKTAIVNRLLDSAPDLIQYENGVPVKVRPFGHLDGLYPTDYVRLKKVNGSYFLNGCIIPDENVLFPPGCFALEVFTSVAHNNYKLLRASCVNLEDSNIKIIHKHLSHQGNRWIVGSYNDAQYVADHTIHVTSNSNYVPPMSIVWNGYTCELDGTPVSAEALNAIFSSPGNNITFTSYINDGAHKHVLVNTHPDTDKHTVTHIYLTRVNTPATPSNAAHTEWQILMHDDKFQQDTIKTIAYRLSNNKQLKDDEIQIVWRDGKCYMNGTGIDPALLFPANTKQISFGVSRSNPCHIHADIQTAEGKAGEITSKCFEILANKWQPIACTITHLKGSKSSPKAESTDAIDVQSPRPEEKIVPQTRDHRSSTVEQEEIATQQPSSKRLEKKKSNKKLSRKTSSKGK